MKFYSKAYTIFFAVLLFSLLFNCKKEALKVAPTVTIAEASSVTANSATVSSTITADGGTEVLSRGVCWNTGGSPTTSDTKTSDGKGMGSFSSSLTSLSPGTTYNLKSYAINAIGTAYSSQTTFKTLALLATLTTTEASTIASTTFSSGGNVTNDGGAEISARGVCWSTAQNPTIADSKTTDGPGSGIFASTVTGLTPGTTYYIRSYSTNSIGTAYGNQVTAITLAILPTVTTTELSLITSVSASGGGNITSDGGAAIIARGVCWSTNQNPTIADSKSTDGTGKGVFTSSLTGLTPGLTYYIRAFATNAIGTAYGNQVLTTITPILPTLTTDDVSNISSISASSGGKIINDGGASIIASGVCWGTSQYPTTDNSKTKDILNSGIFHSIITGLEPSTTYYLRAYSTNIVGTAYGNSISFKSTTIENFANSIEAYPGIVGEVTTTLLDGKLVECRLVNGEYVFQGDIILNPSTKSAALSGQNFRWPNNTVYYTINSSLKMFSKLLNDNRISDAIKEFEGKTNIKFEPRTYQSDYIDFSYHFFGGASSQIGKQGGKQSIRLSDGATTGNVIHEIAHSIGLLHEQSKKSSANYVTIHKENIREGYSHDFEIYFDETTTETPEFDFNSLMLYPSWGFALPGTYTITLKNGQRYPDPQSSHLSASDIYLINILYPTTPTISTIEPTNVTTTSAISGGNISKDGGAHVITKGVCWGSSTSVTLFNCLNYTTNGSGEDSFTSNINGLSPNSSYYIRAYATNSAGTSYGSSYYISTSEQLPTITTISASSITATSAICGGNITSDGNSPIITSGVCWSSTVINPFIDINSNKTTNGAKTGSYYGFLSGLSQNTTYYVRAYATNNKGTSYGGTITFTTLSNGFPTVSTSVVSSITATSAICGGNLLDHGNSITISRGVCWSTNPDPDISDFKTNNGAGFGVFTSSITGLSPNTTYYVRAYATNSLGTGYGIVTSFKTNSLQLQLPSITTVSASSITNTTVSSGGNITSDGGATISARGVCWSTTPSPTIANNKNNEGNGTGSFVSNITGLTANTTYYIRAFATNSLGTAYGDNISFTTNAVQAQVPTLTTTAASSITTASAMSGGNITSDGGASVTARGVCWSTSQNPTAANSKTTDGTGTGSFTSSIIGLSVNTTYYLRAYATNSAGTAYGSQISVTTTSAGSVPTLTTTAASAITTTSATSGGNISSDGGAGVTARGVCWSTTQNPTTANSKTTNGTGLGSFTSSITGLTAGTTYYIRAYATNSVGTNYGSQVSFATTNSIVYGSVSDIDGNTYSTVTIGTQVWMAENLKTTKYKDGTAIPNVTASASWNALTTGAYCWYNNDEANYKATYGAFYNWYSVNTGKLCPTAWHVPSDAEWITLSTFLGGEGIAGGKLREIGTAHWSAPNTGATNSNGFSALPGGWRTDGMGAIGSYGIWWTSTQESATSAWSRMTNNVYPDLTRAKNNLSYGFSIRCVKD